MTKHCWLLLVGLMLFQGVAVAQPFLWSGPYGYRGYLAGGGLSYSRGRLRLGIGFVGGRFYHPSPYLPFRGPPPFGYGRVNVVSITTVNQPPVLVLPPPMCFDPPRREEEEPLPRVPMLPPPPPKKEPPPPPKKDPDKLREKLRPPAAEEDPRDEHARQVRLGREAFALEEYGRATQRFRQAIRVLPGPALPYFLLAQTLMALGKYHEAHDAIVAGLARAPDWPESRFRPLEMYGDAVGLYAEHLLMLEQTLEDHPLDPVLLFLYGYQLWFDGRKDEAGPYFQRALMHTKERKAVERFIRALPAGPTL